MLRYMTKLDEKSVFTADSKVTWLSSKWSMALDCEKCRKSSYCDEQKKAIIDDSKSKMET